MKYIDRFLNSITMYRLVLHGLYVCVAYAIICGFLGIIPFNGLSLIVSFLVLHLVGGTANYIFSKIFKVAPNHESTGITAAILFFILMPVVNLSGAYILIAAAIIAMASKYIFSIGNKHIFNPAAVAAVIVGLAGSGAAIWWVGSLAMLPVILILGLLIVRKIRRFTMFWSFILASIAVAFYTFTTQGFSASEVLIQAVSSWPLLFFATVMLTEPLTTPPTRKLQVYYGIIVGIIFSLQFHFGPVYSTPELALVVGNIFSFIVSSRQKLRLQLKSKTQLSNFIYEFSFVPNQPLVFSPGQYLEWTLPDVHADSRGNRRFFTIASSPTEPEIHLGVRIQQDGSSFKKELVDMKEGDVITAGSLSGEFILPKDQKEKLVFVAGGIGVTPFRSMIKYLIDKKEKRDVTMFYACASETDFVYTDLFDLATHEIGLKIIRIVTDTAKVSQTWKGKTGYITKELLEAEVPDYKHHTYYLSGPDAMVRNYKKLLLNAGVSRSHIRTDYFPGF